MGDELAAMRAYYAQGKERDRLSVGLGQVELARTCSPPPAARDPRGYT